MLNSSSRLLLSSLIFFLTISMMMPFSSAAQAEKAVIANGIEPAAQVKEAQPLSPEISLLREQNKILLDHQANLLTVVTWSLGTLVTVAALLVGFGWWTNFKFYETDKLRLREELESKVIDLQSKAKLEATAVMLAHERALDDRLDSKLSLFRTEVSEMKSSINLAIESVENQVRGIKVDILKVGNSLILAHKGVANAESELREVEEKIWQIRDVPMNILYTQFQGIRAAMTAENEPQIRVVLDRMADTLETHFIQKGVGMDQEQFDSVHGRLKTLEETHPIIATELLRKLESISRIV